jgi:hypothetical protein
MAAPGRWRAWPGYGSPQAGSIPRLLLPIEDQAAQTLAVTGDSPFSGLSEERRAVPANDLDLRSLRQPCSQARRLPVRQRSTARLVSTSTSTVPWTRPLRVAYSLTPTTRGDRTPVRATRRAAATQRCDWWTPEGPCHAGAGPAGEGETDRGESRTQPLGPVAEPPGQSRHLLGERSPSTRRPRTALSTTPRSALVVSGNNFPEPHPSVSRYSACGHHGKRARTGSREQSKRGFEAGQMCR